MTIIIWQCNKWKLSIHWDKRLKWWHFNKRDDVVKITTLWETLFWFSWDYIWIEVVREIYDMWSNDENNKFNLTTLLWIQSFINTITENVLLDKPEIAFIFMNEDIQVSIIDSWYIENMMFFDKDNWLLLIWSGTPYALANYATQLSHKWEVDIQEIFNVCSRFDNSCWKEYDSLYLN